MTPTDFQLHYKDLADAFGSQNFNAKRGSLLFKYVADLPAYWWRALVERMIIENNPKLNIKEAADGERKAKMSIARAEVESGAMATLLANATKDGDERAMELFNMFKKGKGA